jgi:hypothetical protein
VVSVVCAAGVDISQSAPLCKAIVDRLTFNAHIIETGTESWRFKKTLERQQRKGVGRKTA